MKIFKTAKYLKVAGKKERGKRDGSGPFEGSCQHEEKGVGKKKHKGEECPYKEDEDK